MRLRMLRWNPSPPPYLKKRQGLARLLRWTPWGIAQLYRTPRCLLPNASAVHLWETKVGREAPGADPRRVSFHIRVSRRSPTRCG